MLSDCLFSSQNHRFTDQEQPLPSQQTKQQQPLLKTKQQDQWRPQHKLTKMSQEDAGEILEEYYEENEENDFNLLTPSTK